MRFFVTIMRVSLLINYYRNLLFCPVFIPEQ
jgi:hypothetical protein